MTDTPQRTHTGDKAGTRLRFLSPEKAEEMRGRIEDMEAKMLRKRKAAMASGRLATGRLYTRDQIDSCFRNFDLNPEHDFVAVWVLLEQLSPKERTEELERSAAGTNPHGTPLKKVLRWKLHPGRWGGLC